jgi:hypothetical protein
MCLLTVSLTLSAAKQPRQTSRAEEEAVCAHERVRELEAQLQESSLSASALKDAVQAAQHRAAQAEEALAAADAAHAEAITKSRQLRIFSPRLTSVRFCRHPSHKCFAAPR